MPLRDLLYIARLLEKHVNAGNRSIYSSSLIRIPAPRFVVFYNGQRRAEEHTVMKLSDAFEKPETDPALELRVRLVNINPGASPELMEKMPDRCGSTANLSRGSESTSMKKLHQGSGGAGCERMHPGGNPGGIPAQPEIGGSSHVHL